MKYFSNFSLLEPSRVSWSIPPRLAPLLLGLPQNRVSTHVQFLAEVKLSRRWLAVALTACNGPGLGFDFAIWQIEQYSCGGGSCVVPACGVKVHNVRVLILLKDVHWCKRVR